MHYKLFLVVSGMITLLFLFFRKERETFIKKFMAFKPSSLYKVDLMRVQQAGREVSEECAREDIKPASW